MSALFCLVSIIGWFVFAAKSSRLIFQSHSKDPLVRRYGFLVSRDKILCKVKSVTGSSAGVAFNRLYFMRYIERYVFLLRLRLIVSIFVLSISGFCVYEGLIHYGNKFGNTVQSTALLSGDIQKYERNEPKTSEEDRKAILKSVEEMPIRFLRCIAVATLLGLLLTLIGFIINFRTNCILIVLENIGHGTEDDGS